MSNNQIASRGLHVRRYYAEIEPQIEVISNLSYLEEIKLINKVGFEFSEGRADLTDLIKALIIQSNCRN